MNYASIKKCDVANGLGVRVSLFVSGCEHYCKGCFNAEAWSFTYGDKYTEQTEKDILDYLSPKYISGLTLLGGEPLNPKNAPFLIGLVKKAKALYPEKDIWCYTGYTLEELLQEKRDDVFKLLEYIDVLVDGRFIEEEKSPSLRFKGSANQRILLVKETLKAGKPVLWNE